jgi:pimeloyl-ACP methyl ester carboxylesterase
VDPGVDARPWLADVRRPVHLLHGRDDHLIPYTECLRLGHALSPGVLVRATVTSLFGHSAQDPFPGPLEGAREGVIFWKALAGILGVV